MNNEYYDMIFKRKSFHLFHMTGNESLSAQELQQIQTEFKKFQPLDETIQVDLQLLPAEETSCKRGQEYCILLYSEQKEQYLQNIGYLGEQLDLYLTSMNIGTLWFGIGKVEATSYHGLDFVIMIAIKKVPVHKFRKDMFKSKRKVMEELWKGELIDHVSNIVRFAPSACNSQPWFVEHQDHCLFVYRNQKPGKRGIMPADKVAHYNQIDMGIFLLFLEVCLHHENIEFDRTLFLDTEETQEQSLLATYQLRGY